MLPRHGQGRLLARPRLAPGRLARPFGFISILATNLVQNGGNPHIGNAKIPSTRGSHKRDTLKRGVRPLGAWAPTP